MTTLKNLAVIVALSPLGVLTVLLAFLVTGAWNAFKVGCWLCEEAKLKMEERI